MFSVKVSCVVHILLTNYRLHGYIHNSESGDVDNGCGTSVLIMVCRSRAAPPFIVLITDATNHVVHNMHVLPRDRYTSLI
jgi:hypothetical protein